MHTDRDANVHTHVTCCLSEFLWIWTVSVTQFRMSFFMFRLCVGVHWLANSIQIQLALVVRQYTIALSMAVFCQGPKPTCVFSLQFADSFKNTLPPLHAKIENNNSPVALQVGGAVGFATHTRK